MTSRPLTLAEAEFIAHWLAVELMNSENEPIPPFETRHEGKLESCLAAPFQTFGGKYIYRTFAEKAAALFYLITKDHCFVNGNKRMAVTLTLVLCYMNKKWIDINPMELYEVACNVAKSNPRDRDEVHRILVELFKIKIVARA